MFLFVHERIRQYFGGFRFEKCFNENLKNVINVDGQLYAYKSNTINNEFNLECSFKHTNYNRKSSDSMLQSPYLVFVQQLTDNKIVEIHQSVSVSVSFPIIILIKIKDENEKRVDEGINITFSPSKEEQKEYFINHYEEIKSDFHKFISIEPSFNTSQFNSSSKIVKFVNVKVNLNKLYMKYIYYM